MNTGMWGNDAGMLQEFGRTLNMIQETFKNDVTISQKLQEMCCHNDNVQRIHLGMLQITAGMQQEC